MPEFLAETYAPRDPPGTGTAARRAAQAALAADQASRPGAQVRLLGAIVMPEEETCFYLDPAPSAGAVRAAVTRAGLRPDRITRAAWIWSTPGLVETRFSPDALVWVAVVFHGTAAWRNHGLIIFPLLFYRTSVQLRCPAAPAGWRAPPARPPPGTWASPRRAPVLRRGFPGQVQGDAQRHRLRRRRRP